MKKTILFVIVLSLLAAGCKKKPAPIVIIPDVQKNHLQRNHIFGNVKILETQTFYLQKDSISISDTSDLQSIINNHQPNVFAEQHYSADGFLLSYSKLNSLKDTLLTRKYRYSKDALLESWSEYDSLGKELTYGKYLYDINRFLKNEQIYKNDSLVMSFSHSTDGIGNIISSVQSFGNYETKTESKYDENGLVTKIVEYEPTGKIFKTAEIEYDNYGDEVNRCVYKSGNQMIEYTYNKYDQQGRLLKSIYEDRIHNVKEFHYYFNHDKEKNWKYEVCAIDGFIVYVKARNIVYYQEIK